MNFEVNICPICSKPLKLRSVAGVQVYECPTTIQMLVPTNLSSHYTVEKDSKFEIQHMIVLPYSIDTYANATKSRLYKLHDARWRLLHEVSMIRPESEDKLLERIQKLLIFS